MKLRINLEAVPFKNRLFLILLFSFLISLPDYVFCQVISFPSHLKIRGSDIHPVIQGQDVIGYFAYYSVEAEYNKTAFQFVLMDNSFHVTHEITYGAKSPYLLMDAFFNGKVFCIISTIFATSKLLFETMNLDGEITGKSFMEKIYDIPESMDRYIVPLDNIGFLRFGPKLKHEDKQRIEFITNTSEIKYSLLPEPLERKGSNVVTTEYHFLAHSDHVLALEADYDYYRKLSVYSEGNSEIRLFDINTGKEIGVLPYEKDEKYLQRAGIHMNNEGIALFGKYYNSKDAGIGFDDEKYNGIYSQHYDNKGHLTFEKFISFRKEMSAYRDEKDRKIITDASDFWIHNIVQVENGETFVICEVYDRGLTKEDLNRGIFIGDFIVLAYDSLFNFTKATRFEKFRNRKISAGISDKDNFKVGLIGVEMKLYDYKFTTINAAQTMFTSIYTNYEEDRSDNKEFTIGAIAYDQEGNLVNPKITLSNNPKNIAFLPSKTGTIALFEYDSKEKNVALTLYKFDM